MLREVLGTDHTVTALYEVIPYNMSEEEVPVVGELKLSAAVVAFPRPFVYSFERMDIQTHRVLQKDFNL
jgi:hypothetical protein